MEKIGNSQFGEVTKITDEKRKAQEIKKKQEEIKENKRDEIITDKKMKSKKT